MNRHAPPTPRHRHRRRKPCYACIEAFEIECGIIEPPKPPPPPPGRGSTSGLGRGWPADSEYSPI